MTSLWFVSDPWPEEDVKNLKVCCRCICSEAADSWEEWSSPAWQIMAATGYWSPHFLRNSGYYSAVQQASDAGNGEVPTCDLDVTWTCICYFSFYKSPPNIFHIPSPPDFLSARWVVGTNSKERPVGGSVVPTIPKDPSSRISPSALHWWKKSTTSIRFQDSWLHSCSCLVRDGPWNLTVCMMSGRSQATQVLQTHSKMRTWHSPKA